MLGEVLLLVAFDPGLLQGFSVEVTNSISVAGTVLLLSDLIVLVVVPDDDDDDDDDDDLFA